VIASVGRGRHMYKGMIHHSEADRGPRHHEFNARCRNQGHGGGPQFGTGDDAGAQSTGPPPFDRRGVQGGHGRVSPRRRLPLSEGKELRRVIPGREAQQDEPGRIIWGCERC